MSPSAARAVGPGNTAPPISPKPPSGPGTTRALLLMFCALNGATSMPRCAAQRHSAVANRLLPAPLLLPQTIRLRVMQCPPRNWRLAATRPLSAASSTRHGAARRATGRRTGNGCAQASHRRAASTGVRHDDHGCCGRLPGRHARKQLVKGCRRRGGGVGTLHTRHRPLSLGSTTRAGRPSGQSISSNAGSRSCRQPSAAAIARRLRSEQRRGQRRRGRPRRRAARRMRCANHWHAAGRCRCRCSRYSGPPLPVLAGVARPRLSASSSTDPGERQPGGRSTGRPIRRSAAWRPACRR